MADYSSSRRRFLAQGAAASIAGALSPLSLASVIPADTPKGYPADYAALIEGARKEGQLTLLGATDRLAAEPLVKAFEAAFPGIRVTYSDLNTRELDKRYRAEAAGTPVSDVVWSSAMDTQIALIQDGLAQPYLSPEKRNLPSWAEWRGLAYAVTYEPVVFAYHRTLLPEAEGVTSHTELIALLEKQREKLKGKVMTLDVGTSGLALLLEAQDQLANPAHDQLLRALGGVQLLTPANNNEMLKAIASGEALLGYNMLGSYAEVFSRKNPQLGYVIPRDYALVVSRVMLIAARAPHPHAARLWIDFVLSPAGQSVMAKSCGLGSVRDDVDGPFTLRSLRAIPGLRLRPIGVSHRLLDHLDPLKRSALIERWRLRVGTAG